MNVTTTEQQTLLRLARAALQHYLPKGVAPTLVDLGFAASPALLERGAAFVTLRRADGALRGCIGDVVATVPLWESVRDNAIRAATRDPRFPPVTPAEFAKLHIEISVLTPPRTVPSCHDIQLGTHGIILAKQQRRALFLPQVATEQGWDLAETLTHLARKAGLPDDAWRSGAEFQVFEAIVFNEPQP